MLPLRPAAVFIPTILVLCVGVCSLGNVSKSVAYTPEEILAKYQAACQKTGLYSNRGHFKSQEVCNLNGGLSQGVVSLKIVRDYTLLRDQHRYDCRKSQTQYREMVSGKLSEVKHRFQTLREGEKTSRYSVVQYDDLPEDYLKNHTYVVVSRENSLGKVLASIPMVEGTLAGYCINNLAIPIWKIIQEEGSTVQVLPNTVVIDGHETIVVEAGTRYGCYTLNLDPSINYLPRRLVMHQTVEHLHDQRGFYPNGNRGEAVYPTEVKVTMNIETVLMAHGFYMPKQATLDYLTRFSSGESKLACYSYQGILADFETDFSKIEKPFTLMVPEGTKVIDEETIL